MPPDEYVKAYNEKYDAHEEWPGLNWRIFDRKRDMENGCGADVVLGFDEDSEQ